MQNSILNLNMPKPSVEGVNTQTQNKKRTIYPNIKVANVGTISTTPITDKLVKIREQNPKTAYKINFDNLRKKGFKFNNLVSAIIGFCALISFFSLKKSIKNSKH